MIDNKEIIENMGCTPYFQDNKYLFIPKKDLNLENAFPRILHPFGAIMPVNFFELGASLVGNIGMLPEGPYILTYFQNGFLTNQHFEVNYH